jgi:fructose-1,6-bisphosphatase
MMVAQARRIVTRGPSSYGLTTSSIRANRANRPGYEAEPMIFILKQASGAAG